MLESILSNVNREQKTNSHTRSTTISHTLVQQKFTFTHTHTHIHTHTDEYMEKMDWITRLDNRNDFVVFVRSVFSKQIKSMYENYFRPTHTHTHTHIGTCMFGSFSSPNELKDLLYKTNVGLSVYTNNPIGEGQEDGVRCEGFYMRLDDNKSGLLRARCKLVHGSFHQSVGQGRWERRSTPNIVRKDLWIGLDDDGKKEE